MALVAVGVAVAGMVYAARNKIALVATAVYGHGKRTSQPVQRSATDCHPLPQNNLVALAENKAVRREAEANGKHQISAPGRVNDAAPGGSICFSYQRRFCACAAAVGAGHVC
jgi:hypothetical protein